MIPSFRLFAALPILALAPGLALPAAAAEPPGVIKAMDVSAPFAARSDWRFTASQGAQVEGVLGDPAPGPVALCLRRGASGPCDPALQTRLGDTKDPVWAEPHVLRFARVVRPRGEGGPALLLVQTASQDGGDGGHLIFTQAVAYRRADDRFVHAFGVVTGSNNNQETRYIDSGPLRGDIVSAVPAQNAPYGYWVSVSAPGPGLIYRPVLRFRSATRYDDGNSLAVIDAEMPTILARLRLRRAGDPLPAPAGGCAAPHLRSGALWCR